MSGWVLLRVVKFVALAGLAAGLALGAGQRRQADRAAATFWLATPALWLTLVSGYLLMKTTGRSLAEPFVGVALVASLTALHGAVLAATRPNPGVVSRALAFGGLAGATAAMVTRDAPLGVTLGTFALAAALGVGVAFAAPAPDGASEDPGLERWFVWVARAEGASLLAMVLVAMPVRRAFGVSLDGGTGALGWGHGMLVLLYLQALSVTARRLGWSWGTAALAFGSSVVPFGTFVFEAFALRPPRDG